MSLRQDAQQIISAALFATQPDTAVKKALDNFQKPAGKLVLVSVGKAAWQMARAAVDELGANIDEGIVITKYGHSKGPLNQIRIFEAGHPVPDENSYHATEQALELVSSLTENDTILLLLSGGGSALFEKPLINPRELQEITKSLLTRGASITQMNTVRKRFSGVKGGRFAEACAPAKTRQPLPQCMNRN